MPIHRLLASLRVLTGRQALRNEAAASDAALDRVVVGRDELEALIARSVAEGELRAPPLEMLRRVLFLAETTAGEVMTPRTEILGLREHTPLDEATAYILETGHSRYPVYRDALDNVVGIVLARDVWRAQVEGGATLDAITREPLYVPDSKPVDALLREMQREQTHIAVVVDEFGGTAGIVTIEDIIEEIVGEIADELDDAPPEFRSEGGDIIFPGSVAIAALNERFALELPEQDFTTVGGFVMGRLGRMAHAGDLVAIRGGRLRVIDVRKRRVERLALELDPPAT
jgi:CBS domain containing-hemolysin-like protein